MRLTIGRWVAAILACCALVAVVVLPLPSKPKTDWFGLYPQAMSSRVEALTGAASELNDAVRDYRVAQGVARWKAARVRDAVQIDANTPAPIAHFMRTIANDQWRRVSNDASAEHAAVFVYFDTSTIAGAASPNNRRTAEPRRPADVWYALPEVTDGERCIVLVRVRVSAVAQLTQIGEHSLLGPCAYFAAFGKPGPAVHQWLEATNYRATRVADWDRPRAVATDESALYTLDAEASRCLAREPRACARALRRAAATGVPTSAVDGNTLGEGSRHRTLILGDASPRFLADVVRDLGSLRFAQFWASSAPLDSAFADVAHVPLDEWTAQWLERSYGKPQGLAEIQLRDVLWLVVVLPLLVSLGAGRRERVLVERLRVSPTSSS